MFTGTLKVKLVEAVDLRPTDFQRRHNVGLAGKLVESTIDPYVFIDIDEVHVHRTTTKQKTFCPTWNESFQSEVQSGTNLGLTVFHDAAIPPDDFVANCSISFDELINITKDQNSDIWVSPAFSTLLCPSWKISLYITLELVYECVFKEKLYFFLGKLGTPRKDPFGSWPRTRWLVNLIFLLCFSTF